MQQVFLLWTAISTDLNLNGALFDYLFNQTLFYKFLIK